MGAEPEAAPSEEPTDNWEPGDGAPEEPPKMLEAEAHDASVELRELDGDEVRRALRRGDQTRQGDGSR